MKKTKMGESKLATIASRLQSYTRETKSILTIFMLQIDKEENLSDAERSCLHTLAEILNNKVDELIYSEGLTMNALQNLKQELNVNADSS